MQPTSSSIRTIVAIMVPLLSAAHDDGPFPTVEISCSREPHAPPSPIQVKGVGKDQNKITPKESPGTRPGTPGGRSNP